MTEYVDSMQKLEVEKKEFLAEKQDQGMKKSYIETRYFIFGERYKNFE